MHRVLANVSPEHLDAEGRASGAVTVAAGDRDDLSGRVELAFDGPGILRIGEIQQVREMLAARLGPDLAERVLADLRHYPFRTATFQLESQGTDSQLELHVTRQTRTTADRRPPRDEVIGGKAVSVGSVVAPSIDLTVPITGKSLAEILSLVVGLSPQFHTVGSQSAP
jgi:hypothetical protein